MASKNADAMSKPVDWDELYPGRFLKAGLLPERKTLTVTIVSVDREKLPTDDGGKKVKGYLTLRETDMQLVLNKTNGLCLRAMFGRSLPDWIGKRITLFRGTWNGDECIRIWGSPDFDAGPTGMVDVPIQLPKRRAFIMTLRGRKSAAAPQPEPAQPQPAAIPGQHFDPSTGEAMDDMDPEPGPDVEY